VVNLHKYGRARHVPFVVGAYLFANQPLVLAGRGCVMAWASRASRVHDLYLANKCQEGAVDHRQKAVNGPSDDVSSR